MFTDHWYGGSLQRRSDLVEQITLSANRKQEREWDETTWETWLTLLTEFRLNGYLEDHAGLCNLDETVCELAEAVGTVYAER